MKVQMSAFRKAQDEDRDDLAASYDNLRLNFDDIDDCIDALKSSVSETPADPLLLSILQHLLFITDARETK